MNNILLVFSKILQAVPVAKKLHCICAWGLWMNFEMYNASSCSFDDAGMCSYTFTFFVSSLTNCVHRCLFPNCFKHFRLTKAESFGFKNKYTAMSAFSNVNVFYGLCVLTLAWFDLAVCYVDDNNCSHKHDSLSVSLLSWRSVLGCFTTSVIDASALTSDIFFFFYKLTLPD